MKKIYASLLALLFGVFLFTSGPLSAQKFSYNDSWGKQGFNLEASRASGVKVIHSIKEFNLFEQEINGEILKNIQMKGSFLPNDAGAPDLPGNGRFIAMPQGAKAMLVVNSVRTETIENVDIAPAFEIPIDSDDSPLVYAKNTEIFSKDEFYPANPIQISENRKIRGVDVVMLGITPFQYNPVTKQLIVYRDIDVDVVFEGGNGHFGEDRLRSRWWDPLLRDMLLNQESLPEVEYPDTRAASRLTGCEYLIITPNGTSFQMWADSLAAFRIKQGILTDVVTLAEIGGNNTNTIENYIDNAYYNWDIPPAAVLLLGDYGTDASNRIITPTWDSYCVSDHLYADVDYDDQADIVFARITAQDDDQLMTMMSKIFNYETNPPINPNYYNNPITAMGWQTERWFQICSESVNGFWELALGKEPVRENAIYSGSPGGSWSSNQNTWMVVDYFGPNGLGYIPANSAHLTDWGGNATRVNNDINSGAFMMQHRDHGSTTGWGEPDYDISDLSGLTNQDLLHVFSINCLTGKYNISGECFAEAFHRHEHGALSLTAASETSYSFVNDTYVWGMFDNMWVDFMPDYGTTPESRDILPAFGNAAGKYFLEQSDWPYNTSNKEVTYYLFHHHGGAFSTVYSEMPQDLDIVHDGFLIPDQNFYRVQVNPGALICITKNGEIIGTGLGTGQPVDVTITPQPPGSSAEIVITKQNYYRFEQTLTPAGPPFPAANPSPSNNQINVKPYTHLQWENGYGSFSNSYKVYLGTDNPPTNVMNGVETEEPLITIPYHLEHLTTYYWRVESFNQFGSNTSDVWSFETKFPPDENFETGDFSYNMWDCNGHEPFEIEEGTAFDGTYSAKSAFIGDNDTTSLVLTLDVDAIFNAQISFWKMMSSSPKDKLQFLIDGEIKDEWSGLTMFSEEIFSVGDGLHTFEWRYVKDSANSSGDDCAWIDYIYFPPLKPPTATAGEDGEVCEGDNFLCEGMVTNCQSCDWETSGTGTFDDNTKMCPTYYPSAEDIAAGSVTLTINGYGKGDDIVSDEMMLMFSPLPGAPATPEGPDYVDIYYTTTSEYTTLGNEFAETYSWLLTPEDAGEITWEEMNAFVTWNNEYLGDAYVSVMGSNECGDGVYSEELEVTINNTVGLENLPDELAIQIIPNPNNGSFRIETGNLTDSFVDVTIYNILGDIVYFAENKVVSDLQTEDINISSEPEGLYFLEIKGKTDHSVRKVLIRR